MNIIPCLTWVRRGVAKQVPDKVVLDKEDLQRIIEDTQDKIEEAEEVESEGESEEEEGATAVKPKPKKPDKKPNKRKHDLEDEDDIVDRYGLDDYDDEDNESNPLAGIGGLTVFASNEEDPYVTLKDEDSDDDDNEIKPTDNLIVAGHVQDDQSCLEVYVYNEDNGCFYVHHDILLPSFPLCVEWLNYDVADDKPGNFAVVGSMEPTIDIWDLDVVDSLEPVATLGTRLKKKDKKDKKKAKKASTMTGHTDAVLDLSWNHMVRHALASASADFTVGLWDLSQGKTVTTITQHQEKVQCVDWHPFEAQSLLSGSFDHTVKVYDCRSPNDSHKTWDLGGEVERVMWNHFSPLNFYASTDEGVVYYLDSRQDKPIYKLSAHNESVTGLSLSSQIPGLLVTVSSDKTFKVWDTEDNKPSLILERNLKLSELHCVSGCMDSPFVFAAGGQREVKVWDIRESAAVRNHFESRQSVELSAAGGGSGDSRTADTDTSSAMESLSIDTGDSQTQKKKKKKKKKKKTPV